MPFEKDAKLNLSQCFIKRSGSIRIGNPKSKSDDRMTVGFFSKHKFLYWGDPLTRYHIKYRKAKRYLDLFHVFGAIVFAFGFLGFFWLVLDKQNLFNEVYSVKFWFLPNMVAAIFWLSAMSFCYLIYRVFAMQKPPEPVEFFSYSDKKDDKFEDQKINKDGSVVKKKDSKDISRSFTMDAKIALESAYEAADKHGDKTVEAAHLFYALLDASQIASIFLRLGVSSKSLKNSISKSFASVTNNITPFLSDGLHQIIFHAYESARDAKQEYVHVSELLLATVRQSEPLQEILYDLNIDSRKLSNVVEWMRIRERMRSQYKKFKKAAARRSKHGIDRAMTAVATPYLNSFSTDITLSAKYGHLDPCVARDKEIEEIFRIVEGGGQSVLLVGDNGVGKKSIIEGIAQRMVEEDVPARLNDKRLVLLSTSALLAGTTVSGAQERLIHIMNEIGRAKNIILYINNIHDLVSTSGTDGGQGLDVSETLAEYIGGGRFLTFATTTTAGFNKHILNSTLGNSFTKVDINEMDENQAIQVIESKIGSVEYKNSVFFSYDSVAQSVKLASKFLHDQNLPTSAIALISETASFVKNKKGENSLVASEDVGAIISQKTGIPATSITEDESTKLMRLEEEMHKRVIGQDNAVVLIASALRRARAEVRSQSKPMASFLFLGPTGVGKTELAKTIAEVYFGGEDRMIRVDMSEYQDKSGIYRLIGQPGAQGTGILTEAVRQHPFSLVLLDELEKADPDILNLFLQVFDDGRLTDSVGRVIDFTNTIIIATSNAGTSYVQEQIKAGVSFEKIREALIRGELKKYYKPEFLNRFDAVVLFRALERDEIKKISSLMLKRIEKDLEKRGVFLKVEDSALEALAEVGFDPEFGARPMRRAIQDKIENKLADLILSSGLNRRDTVVIGENAEIRVEKA
jgi:ATP-dependent Clp protease ATP-binding subunit ClpC